MHRQSHALHFIITIIFGEGYKLWSVSLCYLYFKTTVHKTLQKCTPRKSSVCPPLLGFEKMFETKYTKFTYTYSLSLHDKQLMQTRMSFTQHTLHKARFLQGVGSRVLTAPKRVARWRHQHARVDATQCHWNLFLRARGKEIRECDMIRYTKAGNISVLIL
jgi:hypothetical protein